jgi:hypothetical protein
MVKESEGLFGSFSSFYTIYYHNRLVFASRSHWDYYYYPDLVESHYLW